MEKVQRDKWRILLKGVAFFKPFTDQELDDILEYGAMNRYEAHSYIVHETKKENAFYVILRGETSVIKGDALRGKTQLAKLVEGDCFGEIAIVLNEARSASVMAVNEVFLFRLDAEQIDKLQEKTQGKLYKQFAVNLANQLKMMSNKASL